MRFVSLTLFAPALFVISIVFSPTTAKAEADEKTTLDTEAKKLSYLIGMDVGASIKRLVPDTEIDLAVLLRAIEDTLQGQEPLLTSEQADQLRQAIKQQMQERLMAERAAQAEKNQTEGEAFLADNKSREGVMTTESGLQYEVIKEGDGAKPKVTDTVTVHYRGTLLDGKEFDSSHKRGQPATFPLKGVIAGWTEGLQLMPVGSTYRFFIPSDLAYGESGAGQMIGPNSTLIFDVELLEIAAEKDTEAEKAD